MSNPDESTAAEQVMPETTRREVTLTEADAGGSVFNMVVEHKMIHGSGHYTALADYADRLRELLKSGRNISVELAKSGDAEERVIGARW